MSKEPLFSCVAAYSRQYDDLLDRVGVHIKNKESVFTLQSRRQKLNLEPIHKKHRLWDKGTRSSKMLTYYWFSQKKPGLHFGESFALRLLQHSVTTTEVPWSMTLNPSCSSGAGQWPSDQTVVLLGSFHVWMCSYVNVMRAILRKTIAVSYIFLFI